MMTLKILWLGLSGGLTVAAGAAMEAVWLVSSSSQRWAETGEVRRAGLLRHAAAGERFIRELFCLVPKK